MVEIPEFRIASAWFRFGEVFPFQVGPNATGEKLGVVRIGGHLNPEKGLWEGVCRETQEEASVRIRYVSPPDSYCYNPGEKLVPTEWPWTDLCRPPAVFTNSGVVFLAETEDEPRPDHEVNGR